MSHVERPATLISGQQKITASHLERLACVYVRQSSREQMLRHQGSQINQYQLAERAAALGWPTGRIRVIDTDLGLSARDSATRSGFKELVAEVSLGHVGIIFGYEVSRLARNNSDWYHLLDLAAVFNTLIADYDGIYNLRLYNDRLLLGLKGTMSEAELHLLQLRLEAGRMRKVERGEHRQLLPTGLVRLSDGTVVKDADEQIRHTLELVLAKFEELGSCRQVLLYLRQAHILLPRRQTHGPQVGEVLWKQPAYAAVYSRPIRPHAPPTGA
jgi:DNA invertase Pin-like site-specific DNA recombinase